MKCLVRYGLSQVFRAQKYMLGFVLPDGQFPRQDLNFKSLKKLNMGNVLANPKAAFFLAF